MLKINKRFRSIIVFVIMLSLLTMYGTTNIAVAASLTGASDTLSDSAPGAAATSTIEFTTGIALGATDYYEVSIPFTFTGVATSSVSCPDSATATLFGGTGASDPWIVKCTLSGVGATGAKTITIANVTNPPASNPTLIISTRHSNGDEVETAEVVVAIISNVTVTATVPATLTFAIGLVNADVVINGATTTATSTSNTLSFGTLTPDVRSTMGQELTVGTNASEGYSVTVQQNRNLTSGNGADIDSFNDGTAANSPTPWAAPSGTLADDNTWGHFGVTTDDSVLTGLPTGYGIEKFEGFSNYLATDAVDPIEVMYHGGPADQDTPGVGKTKVAYSLLIKPLQEAGDYTNTLTYICTPTY